MSLAPGDPEPGNNLASVLLAEGKDREALARLDRVVADHPGYVPALINRGVALARLGRLEEARSQYLRALQLDPENPDASYNLERLREREGGKRSSGESAEGPAGKQTPAKP
jgi:Flp pilus assembly protein TadD